MMATLMMYELAQKTCAKLDKDLCTKTTRIKSLLQSVTKQP